MEVPPEKHRDSTLLAGQANSMALPRAQVLATGSHGLGPLGLWSHSGWLTCPSGSYSRGGLF